MKEWLQQYLHRALGTLHSLCKLFFFFIQEVFIEKLSSDIILDFDDIE